jgi:hypothetical protein
MNESTRQFETSAALIEDNKCVDSTLQHVCSDDTNVQANSFAMSFRGKFDQLLVLIDCAYSLDKFCTLISIEAIHLWPEALVGAEGRALNCAKNWWDNLTPYRALQSFLLLSA